MPPRKDGKPIRKRADETDMYVGARIRALRNTMGKSQTWLAESLGVTFQQIQKYEKGVNRVGAGRLQKIAALLGVSIGDMYPVTNGADTKRTADDDPFLRLSQSKRGHRLARAFNKLGLVDSLVVVSVAEALSADREKT